MSIIEKVEEKLANSVKRNHGVLVGSATTALMLACSLIRQDKSKVAIPANVCLHVVYAILYAGKTPVFIDLDISNANLDVHHLSSALESDKDIGVVIAVHLFGHSANIASIQDLTKKYNILLIEDAAQSQGGLALNGKLLGSFGDLSIFSFGYSKILDAGGGGVLLFDKDEYKNRLDFLVSQLSKKSPINDKLHDQYREAYYDVYFTKRNKEIFNLEFNKILKFFNILFINKVSTKLAYKINEILPSLNHEIEHRRTLYTQYKNGLIDNKYISMFDVNIKEIAPWRFSFRVSAKKRDKLINQIRKNGYDASSWYPSIPRLLRDSNVSFYKIANKIDREIINLWVTKSQNSRVVNNVIKIINEEL